MRLTTVRSKSFLHPSRLPLLPLLGLLTVVGVGALPGTCQAQGGGAQIGGAYGGYAIPSVPPRHRAGLPPTPPVPPGFPSRPVDFARNRISSFTGATTTGTTTGNQGGGALGGQGGFGGLGGQGGGFGGLGGGGFGGLGGGLGGGGLGGLGGGGFGGLGGGGLGGFGGGGFGGLGGGGGFGGGKQFGFDGGSLFDVQPAFRHGVGLGGERPAMDGGTSSGEARALRNSAADFEPQVGTVGLNGNSRGAELRQAKRWALPAGRQESP